MSLRNTSTRALLLGALLQCPAWLNAAPGPSSGASGAVAYLRVEVENNAPLKRNAPVRAHTVEPFYVGQKLLIPANSAVDGRIAGLTPVPRRQQLDAYTHGDFTPLRRAVVHFDRILTPNGHLIPLNSLNAELATTTVRLESATVKRSLLHRLWGSGIDRARGFVRNFTTPGRAIRAREFVYSQLPYHPQALLSQTQYDIPLLTVPTPPSPGAQDPAPDAPSKPDSTLPKGTLVVHSRLVTALDSKTNKQGDPVVARVTQPVRDEAGHILIPVGALIRGSVLRCHPADTLGRAGALRFAFSELVLPSGQTERVTGVPSAIYAQPGSPQQLDNEGGIKPQSRRSALVPLTLGSLAARSFRADENRRTHAAVSSNGFGVITRIIAASSGSGIAGGIVGGISTARAVYSRFIGHGPEVDFPAHTPIEIELNKTQSPVLMGSTEVSGATK